MARKADTAIEGGQAVRDSVRAYIKRLRRECLDPPATLQELGRLETLDRILKWLDGQAKRAASRPGGVERAGGRKGGKGGGR